MYAKFGAKFEIFSEIGTMHKVMEHFLLVWTRTDKNGFIMNTFRAIPFKNVKVGEEFFEMVEGGQKFGKSGQGGSK